MLQCWNHNPESRPCFNTLEERLKRLLENGMAKVFKNKNAIICLYVYLKFDSLLALH